MVHQKKPINRHLITIALIAITIFVVKMCEQEPKIKIVTETEFIIKTDTIKETNIDTSFIVKYVQKIKTIKGKDSIIYVDRNTDDVIEAREYDAQVKTDSATANLKITTTGELLDVQGSISWIKEEKTITITKIKPKSGLFLYGETSITDPLKNIGIGVDYQFRNTLIIGVGANFIDNKPYLKGKIGVRIF